jgi:hypothetical protein
MGAIGGSDAAGGSDDALLWAGVVPDASADARTGALSDAVADAADRRRKGRHGRRRVWQ